MSVGASAFEAGATALEVEALLVARVEASAELCAAETLDELAVGGAPA